MPSQEDAIEWVEWSALGIELLAIGLIVATILVSTVAYLLALAVQHKDRADSYERYRRRLGRALLLGLEILVAADIVRTVALDSTMNAILSLGLLVIIRTFLSWSVVLEVEGFWPWKRPPERVLPTNEE
ncbi:DUF1622 domain-containing protein [Stenotrophomonas rhizophila]|uniref:Membrane protein n=1 Tax=Stenotrophomonas rhizophila TaxID=216778 RepID=A0AAW5PI90_9GAMM|nr:DUF1622 domain-containing protein [Stenotrophomonas rhizophila]MCS4280091.1 putative membrane protein [Stenotrophomonas rhizophila]